MIPFLQEFCLYGSGRYFEWDSTTERPKTYENECEIRNDFYSQCNTSIGVM
jgi:hypothetical protein